MSIAIEPDHVELTSVVRAFLREKDALAVARQALDAEEETLPPYWGEMAALGWMGLHLPEAHGGSGFGLLEQAVILEEMGRVTAPGPFLPTVLASAVLAATGSPAQCARWLPGLARGELVAAVALDEDSPVLGAHLADLLLLPRGGDMVVLERDTPGLSIIPCASLDRSRRVANITRRAADAAEPANPDHTLPGAAAIARRLARTLAAAEAAGGAQACTETASAYARERVQFGRPIGTFQAIKHTCADMLARSELATAAAWDAARTHDAARSDGAGPTDPNRTALASAAAAVVALPAYLTCATDNMQVHGGVGYTWEHDAHLHLRRAASLKAWCGSLGTARVEVNERSGDRPVELQGLDLPADCIELRDELRAFRQRYESLPKAARQDALIDAGLLLPHWPPPWGRAATAMEQIIMDEELAGIPRGHPFAWVALTLVSWGDPVQQERWVRPVLHGTLTICQLFSEPGAGSDLAALRTRAIRVEGGWSVTGQKVWTSAGHTAAFGFALVRTDPEAPKRGGITAMMIDMHAPGVEVRPIRQITGDAQFDEVFLDEVFVPDEYVVGGVNEGWKVARATMGNERVALGGGGGYIGIDKFLACARANAGSDGAMAEQVGEILAEHRVLQALDLRRTSRALTGAGPGVEGNVTKLLGNELDQRMTRLAMEMLGAVSAGAEGPAAEWAQLFLFAPCLTIGGGTSEMARNAIAERMLGLPRDPILP